MFCLDLVVVFVGFLVEDLGFLDCFGFFFWLRIWVVCGVCLGVCGFLVWFGVFCLMLLFVVFGLMVGEFFISSRAPCLRVCFFALRFFTREFMCCVLHFGF